MAHDDRPSAAPPASRGRDPTPGPTASGASEAAAWWRQLRLGRWLAAAALLLGLALVIVLLLRGVGHG